MKIKIIFNGREMLAERGELLSDVLIRNGAAIARPCAGRGTCGKCRVLVDGVPTLSCKYLVEHDISVTAFDEGDFLVESGAFVGDGHGGTDLVLDLGTTTLALALIDRKSKSVVRVVTATNPQRSFGADVISRIEYCQKHGVDELTHAIRAEVSRMIRELGAGDLDTLYVAGNTTMLHIFAGVDPSSMGAAPYTPSFLDEVIESAEKYGIAGVRTVRLLPSVSAFVGADVVAGIYEVGLPTHGYRMLIDLGTNAEIALLSRDKIVTTSAAAGPCFEGACISSGMSATEGAIYAYDGVRIKTINDAPARGICGTGLIDIIAFLLGRAKIDASGRLDEEEFEILNGISVTQEDIRQYQLAKSAIYSAVVTLANKCNIEFSQVHAVYISGGFSARINAENAAITGLIPKELADRSYSIGNSSLNGAIRSILDDYNLSKIASKASYIDLSCDTEFADLFIKSMGFAR